ncbi:MAG: diguanylate cyclase [Lachnospiraceae bacterium]|nr:diguanylate cyclase [Lachnospiraceae bacterium]
MKTILVVDDNSVALNLVKSILSDTYSVVTATSGEECIRILETQGCDLILLDIRMPNLSGVETLKKLKENELTAEIPIIFLTGDTDPEMERECFELGAYDVIRKPFQKTTLKVRISRTLELIDLQKDLKGQLLEKTKEITRISLKSMMMIANTVDKKDPLAANHSTNVAWFAVEIAKRMGWNSDELFNLQNLALVHDIGNICVSDNILRKDGPLTSCEYEAVQKHTSLGRSILQDLTVIRKAAEVAETHHEHYDGTGYPNGLSGDAIPIESRIIAVADALDSMTSDRSFRKKLDNPTILHQLENGRGTQFDPAMADIAISLVKENKIAPVPSALEPEVDLASESSRLLQKVLQEYTKEVKTDAQKDALTGLWNRAYTIDFLNEYLIDKRHCGCFFMIDIDGFKRINDTYGHITGDSIIIRVAETLKKIVRSDDIVCRIGGDEFIVFFKGVASREFASSKAEEIILTLDRDPLPHNIEHRISVSIGIATAPYDGNDFVTLYNKADKALYHVKENGKHSYHFYSDVVGHVRSTAKSTQIDLEYLRRFISEPGSNPIGAYQVKYDTFKKIYNYMLRAQKRSKTPLLLLLLTLSGAGEETLESDVLDSALACLKDSVTNSLRCGDVATNYSSSQFIVILTNATEANGYTIAERIRSRFYKNIDDPAVKLNYVIDSSPEAITDSSFLDRNFDVDSDESFIVGRQNDSEETFD